MMLRKSVQGYFETVGKPENGLPVLGGDARPLIPAFKCLRVIAVLKTKEYLIQYPQYPELGGDRAAFAWVHEFDLLQV